MQLQEQVSVVSSAVVSWIGAELTSVLQLLFFLTLGYTVTRTWIFTRRFGQNKAKAKKLDDIDLVLEEIQGTSCSESDTTPMVKSKSTRLSNAAERKSKKTKVKVLLEELPQEPLPEQCPEQSTPESEVEAPLEAADTSTAEESSAPVSERVAKMMAKKMQRKAKKEQEKTAVEDKAVVEEKSEDCDVEKPKVEPPIVALVETVTDAEALADDMAQTVSTHSMTKVTPKTHKKNKKATTRTPVEKTPVEKAPVENTPVVEESVEVEICSPIPSVHKSLVSVDSLANMETDAQSDSEEVHSSQPGGISTPEPEVEPCTVEPQPYLWSGAGVPQIEGWVAVAVPAEYAPAGAPGPFDGLWKNDDGEKIVVDHEEILFESGMKWVMEMESLTSLSVKIGNEVFSAELDTASQQLVWNDGDTWMCVGHTDAQQQWATAREAEGMPCVLLGGEQMFPMMDPMMSMPLDGSMPMMTMPPTQIPEDAKEWETCYDWAKKGWCKWGASCEWYHPGQPQMQFQGSCEPCAPDAPFFGF